MARVLILCPYPERTAASQRFRFEQYIDLLRQKGYTVVIEPFLGPAVMTVLYSPGHVLQKAMAVMRGLARRVRLLLSARTYDFVLVHREMTPLGPPVLEAILLMLHRRVIFDFDDAIYLRNTSSANRLTAAVKWPSKTRFIARRAWKVVVSTPYLANWSIQHNRHTVVLPTTVDLAYHRPVKRAPIRGRRPSVGWTGTHSTAKYLDLVRPALRALQARYEFDLVVICDVDPGFPDIRNYQFIHWCLETEIEDLCKIDIGLMPHDAGEWEMGKAGFKAIQYSAVEAVPVASSVGPGSDVVIDGRTGILVRNDTDEWSRAIGRLIDNPDLVEEMGRRGRQLVREKWSLESQSAKFLALFADSASKAPA